MDILTVIFYMLMIFGMLLSVWIIFGLLIMLYGWYESKILIKRIPDKIKKEVEDGRSKRQIRREEAGREYARIDSIEPAIEAAVNSNQSKIIPGMDDVSSIEADRIPEPSDRINEQPHGRVRKFRRLQRI